MPTACPGTSNAAHAASSSGPDLHPWMTNSFLLSSTHTVGLCPVPVSGSIPMDGCHGRGIAHPTVLTVPFAAVLAP